MRKLAAAVVAALPLLAVAQDAAQPAGQPAAPQPPPAAQPPQYPAQYAPPPQYTPPPPQYAPPPPQYAPQQQYAPPPGQYAQPPPQPAQQGQYAPPPQYAPPGQYAPPQQYGPPRQPPPPYLRPEKQRDRWYIGFGLGGGNGRVKFPGESLTFEDFLGDSTTPVSFNFKIGATVNPRLLLGLDLGIITAAAKYQTATGDSFERTLGIANIDGVATFFPMERGFFVRAGIGLSSLSVTDTLNGTSNDRSASGANVLAGVGYAFWLGRSFNLTVNLDVSAQSYGSSENWYADQGPDSSSFWTFGLGFDWY